MNKQLDDLNSQISNLENQKATSDKTLADLQAKLKEAQTNLDGKTAPDQSVEDLQNQLAEAQENAKKTQSDLDSANTEYTNAKKAYEEAVATGSTSTSDLKKKADDAKAAVDNQQANVQAAQQKANDAQKNLDDYVKTLSDEDVANFKVYETELAKNNQLDAELEAALQEQSTKLEEIKKTKPAVDAEFEKLGKKATSIGFFTWLTNVKGINCTDALDVFDASKGNKTDKQKTVLTHTHIGNLDDATSLKNIKQAIAIVKKCNEIRKTEGKSELLITPMLMAIGQVNANYSTDIYEHAKDYNVGENLFVGLKSDRIGLQNAVDNHFDAWYTQEKEKSKNGVTEFEKIGHYLNIINGTYECSGAGVGPNGATQEFDFLGDDNCKNPMTTDEFEALLDEYYQSTAPTMFNYYEKLWNTAQTEADKVSGISERYNESSEKLYNIYNKFQKFGEYLTTYDKYDALKYYVTVAQEEVDSATKSLNELQKTYDEAETNPDKCLERRIC